jgi:hypothetical protein
MTSVPEVISGVAKTLHPHHETIGSVRIAEGEDEEEFPHGTEGHG